MMSTSSRKGKTLDIAAISLALAAAVLILALLLQFFLWLKVRFDVKASIAEWKGVIEHAIADVEEAREAFAGFREAQARLEASNTALSLKQTALEESFAHFNAKTVARAREEAKSARREARTAEAEAETRAPAPADPSEALAAALAEQQALGLPGAPVPPAPHVTGRLRPKRIGA